MKFTLSWLKQHLDTKSSLEEITDKLTAIGLELENIDDPSVLYAPFKVAEIVDAQPHPDADKLQILTVNSIDGTGLKVVCGAPNARAGMKGIFAPEGSYIPGLNVTLKKTKIRGVESNGMMVSEKEMCLSEEHAGIIEVDTTLDIGTPMADIFCLNDPIIEIGLTPNRADCAGVRGIARDLAAAGLGDLKPLDEKPVKGKFKSKIEIVLNDTDGCPHFLGREIRGLKNGPSPAWLQNLLKAVGMRPISALVDVTNFFSQSYARPLHVYDTASFTGNIRVAAASGKENLNTLDDKNYNIPKDAIAIYNDSGILGLGGILGGTSTACNTETTSVFLECAYFKPERIARTGRDVNILSDARYRFERGVDPAFTAPAIELATRMIIDLCGTDDTEISEIVKSGEAPDTKRVITYTPNLMKTLIGADIPADRQVSILQSLGFQVEGAMKKEGPYEVTPPSWRGDVFGSADLTEEIIRIEGLDSIPSQSVTIEGSIPESAETILLSRTRQARQALATHGLHECVTWSFVSQKAAQLFGLNNNEKRKSLTIVNAISSEIDVMRPSILPNLIEAADRNAAQGYGNVAFYEVGPVFDGVKPQDQKTIAAGIRAGNAGKRYWADNNASRPVDAYDAKSDALAALEAIGAPAQNVQVSRDAPNYFHPGRSGVLRLGKNALAVFGEIHPSILEELDVQGPVVGFEIFLDNIPTSRNKGTEKAYLTLDPLQPVAKDFAFIVDEKIEAATIIRAVKSADKKLIKNAYVFDIYQGKGVDDGKKSIALSVTLQPREQTLTDKNIEAVMNDIAKSVAEKTGGVLRS